MKKKTVENKSAKSSFPGAENIFALDQLLMKLWSQLVAEADANSEQHRTRRRERRELANELISTGQIAKWFIGACRECVAAEFNISEYKSVLDAARILAERLLHYQTSPVPGPNTDDVPSGKADGESESFLNGQFENVTLNRLGDDVFPELHRIITALVLLRDHVVVIAERSRPRSGRPPDKQKAAIIRTVKRERDKGTPWKDIPKVVKKQHGGKTLEESTLKKYFQEAEPTGN
jgi:hypothetical protein